MKPEGHAVSHRGHIVEWWLNKTTGEWAIIVVRYVQGRKCAHAADWGKEWKRGGTDGGI